MTGLKLYRILKQFDIKHNTKVIRIEWIYKQENDFIQKNSGNIP